MDNRKITHIAHGIVIVELTLYNGQHGVRIGIEDHTQPVTAEEIKKVIAVLQNALSKMTTLE